MLNLYRVKDKEGRRAVNLSDGEKASIVYHDLFDFPLNFSDLIKWRVGQGVDSVNVNKSFSSRSGCYFLEGKSGVVYKRMLHKRISSKKILIAKKYAYLISFIPSIKMVAMTGSLAMNNASEESDIDLLIVVKRNTLWTTRFIAYSLLWLFGVKTRKPNDKNQKDKLCLNMWVDESDLNWKVEDQNIYTAHEIAQIVPLINKSNTYENFLRVNNWVLKYWPNSIRIVGHKGQVTSPDSPLLFSILNPIEKVSYWIQKKYMEKKISRETVTPTRALFHPQDWGRVVIKRLTT